MKKVSRRIIAFFICVTLCIHFNTIVSKADATVYIALSSSSISIGNTVTATINVDGSDISAYTIYVSYDASVLQFEGASGSAQAYGGGGSLVISGAGAGSVSATFTAIANGTSSISTSGSEVYNINLEQIPISHAGATVTVSTPDSGNSSSDNNGSNNDNTSEENATTEDNNDGKSSNCNLASLQISPGVLEPAFSPSTTYYYVQVDKDVTSMVVSATPEDENATIDVWGAGLIEPGENTVSITVTAENGAVKAYNIRVVAGEDLGDATVTIDNVLYKFSNDEDALEVPEEFSAVLVNYKEWEILAFESPNKKIKIVSLYNEDDEYFWFIYDEKNETFTPYNEYSSNFNRYIILPIPEGVELPQGFEPKQISINNNKIDAYQNQSINDKFLYLVYAMNISGDEGFYLYDTSESTFMRYVPMIVENEVLVYSTPTEATQTEATPTGPVIPEPVDEGFFTRQVLIYCLCGAGAFLLVLLFCLIAFGSRIKSLNGELDKADDMINQLATDKKSVDRSVLNDNKNIDSSIVNADKKVDSSTANADKKSGNSIVNDDKSFESLKDIELPDVDELVNQVNALSKKTMKDNYDPDKDSAFVDDNNE